MKWFWVYSYETRKKVGSICAANHYEAWAVAEGRGWDSNNYYII